MTSLVPIVFQATAAFRAEPSKAAIAIQKPARVPVLWKIVDLTSNGDFANGGIAPSTAHRGGESSILESSAALVPVRMRSENSSRGNIEKEAMPASGLSGFSFQFLL